MSSGTSGPPPIKRMIVPALFVGALFLVVFLRQPNGPQGPDQWVLSGQTMGTVFNIKLVVPEDGGAGRDEVAGAVRSAVDEVDRAMSTYRPDSELSRFNRQGAGIFAASRPLLAVMAEASRIAHLSGGALDITVAPLVNAWGFGPQPASSPPSDDEIEALRAEIGVDMLEIDTVGGTLKKSSDNLRCDLSAIAKGYAVDLVAERLKELGFADFMVEIGGEVRASGTNAAGEIWRIGVERPGDGRAGVWSVIALENRAMATSGDYRHYYEIEGHRISHTIDPRTGRPITHRLASVTVLHPSCMTADALATAINVLGPEEGKDLVEREGLAALCLIRSEDGTFEQWASAGWPGSLENTDATPNVGGSESL